MTGVGEIMGSIFGIGYEYEVGKFLIDYKQATEFVGIFVCGLETLVIFHEAALHELVEVSNVIIPLCIASTLVDEKLADRLLFFAYREDGKLGEAAFAHLVRCLFDEVRYFYKIARDGAEVFAIQFGVVLHVRVLFGPLK
jgi:hypothetical protein